MTNPTRREWMERIRINLQELAALTVALLDDWPQLSNPDRAERLEELAGRMTTIITMVKGRFMFNGNGEQKK